MPGASGISGVRLTLAVLLAMGWETHWRDKADILRAQLTDCSDGSQERDGVRNQNRQLVYAAVQTGSAMRGGSAT